MANLDVLKGMFEGHEWNGILNGIVDVLNGILNGSLDVLNGSLDVLNGSLDVLNGIVDVLNGSVEWQQHCGCLEWHGQQPTIEQKAINLRMGDLN